jgi:hypothetical protein
MLCGPATTRNYLSDLKSSIEIVGGYVLRVKRVFTPPTVSLIKGSSEEGISEYYRNCHFVKKD